MSSNGLEKNEVSESNLDPKSDEDKHLSTSSLGNQNGEVNCESEESCNDTVENQPSFNRNLSADEDLTDEVLQQIRGDAIGSTLYSERFVISTLLKLREIKDQLENDESLERDLESLWDMTVEPDVVSLLLSLDVYDVFIQCMLNYKDDGRLIEILVGIIGNMCSVVKEAINELSKNKTAVDFLIQILSTDDSCVLIQLMRLFSTIFLKSDSKSETTIWKTCIRRQPDFIEQFCFILQNSNNETLLSQSLETLNAILANAADAENDTNDRSERLSFLEHFASVSMVMSTFEAFQTLYSKETVLGDDNFTETEVLSESIKKVFIVFLNIHDILRNYTKEVYDESSTKKLQTGLMIILSSLSKLNMSLSTNIECVFNILELLSEFYLDDSDLQCEETTTIVASMWHVLNTHVSKMSKANVNDFESDHLDGNSLEDCQKLINLLEKLLKTLLSRHDVDCLEKIFQKMTPEAVHEIFKLCGVVKNNCSDKHLKSNCQALAISLNNKS